MLKSATDDAALGFIWKGENKPVSRTGGEGTQSAKCITKLTSEKT